MVDFRSRRRGGKGLIYTFLHLLPGSKGKSDIELWSVLAKYAFFALIGIVIVIVFLFIWYGKDLPQPGKLITSSLTESTRIYDRNGILLYSVYKDQNRAYVQLKDIPKNLQHATIAIEDRNFYQNSGFSVRGYLRALWGIVTFKGISGGSTLTQQLVKNVLLQDTRQTIQRKIKELILAIQVDKRYTKDQILEMYLNDVPYGGANIGVEAAAESYFGKHVNDLDLAQAAFIAGLPQAPSLYSPFSGHKYYLDRTKAVLTAMVEENYITQKQADIADKEVGEMTFSDTDRSIKAPHFVMYIKQLVAQQFGDAAVENGGLQIYTTLDYSIEQKAEDIVKTEIGKLKNYHVANGAAMVMNPKNGQILAMVGNTDYFDNTVDGNYNDAVDAKRQPGSSLKPIIYATGLMKGYTASTVFMDVKTDFPSGDPTHPNYTPVNYDGKFHGPVQMRFALGNSMNIPAVKMLALVGIKDAMTTGYQMGIDSWEPTSQNVSQVGLSLVLGGREVTLLHEMTAYSTLADGGVRHDPISILKITDSHGNTLFQNKDKDGTKVLPPDVDFIISHILLDNNARTLEFGPSSYLVIPGHTVSVKTGTTDDKRDNWTMGYTPSYVVGVWVGNNDNSPMNQAISSGLTGASPIWNKIMTSVLKGKPDEQFQKPDNVNAVTIDSLFGGLPVDGQPTRVEYFIKGTEPTSKSSVYQEKDGKMYYVVRENDPVSTDGINRWQIGIDNWIHENHSAADYQWYPPDDLLKSLGINPTQPPSPTP
ncbi:MAG TPA: PBP1A family penicillin-binding protein [Patescibacteria group bacterium]